MPLWNAPQATAAEVEAAAAAAAAAQQTADQALDDASIVWSELVFTLGLGTVTPASAMAIAPVTGTYVTTSISSTAQHNVSIPVTPTIGGTPITNGAATLLSTDAAGTVRTATATGANAVTAMTTSVLVTPTAVGNSVTGRLTVMCGFRRS